jgi:uncharacterized membrane protein YqaE (UPF0057 family)
MKKYLWFLPALYVSYEFGGKIFEVLADKREFVDIISAIKPLIPISFFLAYGIGVFDFTIAIALLTFSFFPVTKKYHKYIFQWTILWPFVPSSLRYFTGVAPFEIRQVLLMSFSAYVAYVLWSRFSKK